MDLHETVMKSNDKVCDVCLAPGEGTMVDAATFNEAVKNGFNPFELSELLPTTSESDFELWKNHVSRHDARPWRLCNDCFAVFQILAPEGPDAADRLKDLVEQRLGSTSRLPDPVVYTTQSRAREIMRSNFLGIEELSKTGLHLTKRGNDEPPLFNSDAVSFLEKVPFSEDTLMACKKSHVLMVGHRTINVLSLWDHWSLDKSHTTLRFSIAKRQWYRGQLRPGRVYFTDYFAMDEWLEDRWYLVRRDILPGSVVPPDEDIARAVEVAYLCIFYFLAHRGRFLFNNKLLKGKTVRCKDLWMRDKPVDPGHVFVSVGEGPTGGFRLSLLDLRHEADYTHRNPGLITLKRQK